MTAALIAESENWCISATLTQAPRANDVAPWPGAAADFAMLLTADDLPGVPFQFGGPHCVIADGRRFLASLQADVRRGIDGPRAMYGAVQTDLIRLCEILTTTESRRPLLAASAVSAAVHWLHHGYTPPEGVDMKRVATGNLIGNVVP
ncbi:MAG TPA: hypothetical protein VMV69_04810 [Pirellulales bacterium]|nr:hypothetical protein [Pirellulales bacterium]